MMRPAESIRFNRGIRKRIEFAAIALALVLTAAAPAAEGPIILRDVTAASGIDFLHTDGSSGQRYIVETVASGLATFDYDGDGMLDAYFVNGAPLAGAVAAVPPRNALYRNLGGFRFIEVTAAAGVGDTGYGLGVTAGDYNNDGRADLYVSNYGANVMYRNLGDGTFAEISRQAGTAAADPNKAGAGVCFLDIEGDGDLDLFVANYVDFSYDKHIKNMWRGFHIYPGPERFPSYPSMLFRNDGDGTFTDISRQSGIGAHSGPGMGIVCADHDADGDTDIFVGNDGGPGNFLFDNDGQGRFEEMGQLSGLAFDGAGVAHGSMGADSGDYNHDGRLDFYVTAYQEQLATLFENLGDGFFDDVTTLTGAGQGSLNHVKWGCGFVDFDNDGHKDLFIACGHLIDNVELFDDTTSYPARPVLLRANGRGQFVNVSDSSGDGLLLKLVARGAAFDDLDNDGRVDVVILNSRRPAVVLRNESTNDHHWIAFELRGTSANRDGVGARVKVVAGDLVQFDEVHSGRSYQSHFGSRLHFGLGPRDRVDHVEVRWIGGGSERFDNLPVDRRITLTEGDGQPIPVAAAPLDR